MTSPAHPESHNPLRPLLASPLPSASAFDFVPMVHAVVSRLLLDPADKNALQPKDLPAAVLEIKHKLQRARAAVEGLPDIERTIADQEAEIRDLEHRIRRQRDTLRGLGEKFGKANSLG